MSRPARIREDILNEKVLSAILEIKVPVERTEEIIRLVREVEKQIDTVVALGVATRCDENGEERHGGSDSGAAGLQTGAGQDQHRAGPDHQSGRRPSRRAQVASEMTNTLHRYGDAESFRDDYVVFAIC